MGQALIKGKNIASFQMKEETMIFALWTINDVRELWKRFQKSVYGFALVEAQFESIMAFKADSITKHVDMETLFDVLDINHDGRIDGLELLGGLTLCCQGTFEEKSRFCFEMYDFNLNASMSKKEMTIMMMASICGMNTMTGGDESLEPTLEDLHKLVDDAYARADRDSDGQVNYEEFVLWARSNRDLMFALEALNKLASAAKGDCDSEDSAEDAEEGDLSDVEVSLEHGVGNDAASSSSSMMNEGATESEGSYSDILVQWLGQIHEPTNYKASRRDHEGPDTNLELCWVHGFKAQGARNNVRWSGTESGPESKNVVLATAALGVVYNTETRTQTFYQGHSSEVISIATHPNGLLCATGDSSSNIHLWDMDTKVCVLIIKGIVKAGVNHLAFSPSGDRLATVGMDPDHTVALYNAVTGELISSAKGLASPNNVFDMAFSTDASEIVLVGKKHVKFYRGVDTQRRSLDSVFGRIGKLGRKQTFMCVTYLGEDAIVGCASGELYRFKSASTPTCVQVVQAHAMQEPVLSIYFNRYEGVLVTGGKDSVIRSWDATLKEVGLPLDMSEDLEGDGTPNKVRTDTAITSVQQIGARILIGTRGSDVYEARMPTSIGEPHSLTRVMWGHCKGELWGLATHPVRDEFATSGDDQTVRVWSIRTHDQVNMRAIPFPARVITYNAKGDILSIGMEDGSVALMEADTANLRVYFTWKHSSKPITSIKFSPDGKTLAVGSCDRNIYIYQSEDQRNYRRQAVCRGHCAAVTHLDFSANSLYIQSNGADLGLFFWDTRGNQIKQATSLRDLTWASIHCIYNWSVKGIWPSSNEYRSILTSCAIPEVGDVITGDRNGKVNLLRYPCLYPGSLRQAYVGHSSAVTKIRVSANKRYIISIGGKDRTILLWKHEVELVDSSGDEAGSVSSVSSDGGGTGQHWDAAKEIADVGHRSALHEAMNSNRPTSELIELIKMDTPDGGDDFTLSAPWKTSIIEPSKWSAPAGSDGTTDVDLTLKWVHGYRSLDCRNNLRYSASGKIVYNAGAIAIAYSKASGKQKFLQGAHQDEVLGIAIHPNGHIFATGEAGRKPTMVIWSCHDMRVLGRIKGAHERGIPLLAFNSRGNLLASIGLDNVNTLCLHDWSNNIEITRTPTEKNKILCLTFLANPSQSEPSLMIEEAFSGESVSTSAAAGLDIIVTGGKKHLKFWWAQGQNVKSQKAMWGKEKRQTIMIVASGSPDVCVTGSSTGTLLVWHNFKAVSNTEMYCSTQDIPYAHKGHPIQAIWAIHGTIDQMPELNDPMLDGLGYSARYLTGDKEGNICIWRLCLGHNYKDETPSQTEVDKDVLVLKLVQTFNLSALKPSPTSWSVRSLCEKDGVFLIGTQGSEIYEVVSSSIPFYTQSKYFGSLPGKIGSASAAAAVGGGGGAGDPVSPPSALEVVPADFLSQRIISGHGRGEVWGLASHPNLAVYFTSGDDHTIRCWSIADNKLISYLTLKQKSRALAVLPTDGSEIAIAFNSGKVWILATSFFTNPNNKPGMQVDDKCRDVTLSLPSEPEKLAAVYRELPDGPSQWVQAISYSFEGSILAVGSHDTKIYLYDSSKGSASSASEAFSSPSRYRLVSVCTGHSSFITHIDFGVILNPTRTINEEYDLETNQITQSRNLSAAAKAAQLGRLQSIPEASSAAAHDDEEDEPIVPSRALDPLKDLCMQTTCGDHCLYFWKPVGGVASATAVGGGGGGDDGGSEWRKITSSTTMRDVWWATWTSPLGWPVQGIWPPTHNGVDYNAVARSHSWRDVPVVATVDNFGRLKLFNYPCLVPGAPDKCYKGHAHSVTNATFTHNDSHIITTGGNDRCVFVWSTDIAEELRERNALKSTQNFQLGSAGGNHETPEEFLLRKARYESDEMALLPAKCLITNYDAGDTGGGVAGFAQPWKGVIREPSDWNDSQAQTEAPAASLELKFVYGYRGWDCRNNLGYAGNKNLVIYHTASVGIVYHSEAQTQIHNTDHDDDIICLAVHPSGHTVATGEVGLKPKIVVWDANTGVTITTLHFHRRGVSCLAFSSDGELLVSAGMDDDHMIAVHNIATGSLVGMSKAGRGINIFSIAVSSDGKFVTGGKNHVKFWDLPSAAAAGGEIASKGGLYSNSAVKARTVVSCAYLGTDAVTGMIDGTLLLWKERANTKFVQAHAGPVTALCSLPETGTAVGAETGPRIISGGLDGQVHIWSYKLTKTWSLNMHESTPVSLGPLLVSLATIDNRLLIGTKCSEIYEVNILNKEIFRLTDGHYEDRAEVWGLDVHPSSLRFATCGDDRSVRLWDGKNKQQIAIADVQAKARAVAFRPDGTQIAVATYEGKIHVLSPDLKELIVMVSVSSQWIEAIRYSPCGQFLAVGSHDCIIYLLDTKSYSCQSRCKGHKSYITAMDFSVDSTKLQSSSGEYELLFWDVKSGRQIKAATEMRDVKWATFTSPLGWPVQGIWPAFGSGGGIVSSVDRCPRGKLIVSGDTYSSIKLFNYPSPLAEAQCKEYSGHSDTVVRTKFSFDGQFVFSIGGLDKAICQYELKRPKEEEKGGFKA